MAIDRIGKGGGLPPAGAQDPAAADPRIDEARPAARAFAVEKAAGPIEAQPLANAEGIVSTSPLARLRAGEIDVNGYVDLKVAEATRGLAGVGVTELEAIKDMLREQITHDPTLVELVRAATGAIPRPPED